MFCENLLSPVDSLFPFHLRSTQTLMSFHTSTGEAIAFFTSPEQGVPPAKHKRKPKLMTKTKSLPHSVIQEDFKHWKERQRAATPSKPETPAVAITLNAGVQEPAITSKAGSGDILDKFAYRTGADLFLSC